MALYHPSGGGRPSQHLSDPKTEVAKDLDSALAHASVCILHNDAPQWRDLRVADFSGIHRTDVLDGRRIQRAEAMEGVEQGARHACRLANQE